MAAGYGPPRIDFGSIGQNILGAYDQARKQALQDQQQAVLGDLGKTLAAGGTPDYVAAGAKLLPFSPEFGFKLMQLGQSQEAMKGLSTSLGGILGGGTTQPAAPTAPTQQSFDARSVPSFITATQEKYPDLPAGYLGRTAQIESNYNPNAVSPTGPQGLMQFTGKTAASMGLTDRFDPIASTDAAARLGLQNMPILASRLGRPPEAWELYMAHQQGAGGASAILGSNPNTNVVDALTPVYAAKLGPEAGRAAAQQAVVVNGGSPRMTAGQFAALWRNKYGTEQQTAGIPTPATGAGLPTMGMMDASAGSMTPEGFAIPGQMAQGPQLAASQPSEANYPGARAAVTGGSAVPPGFAIPGQPAFPQPATPPAPQQQTVTAPGGAVGGVARGAPQSRLAAALPQLLAASLNPNLPEAARTTTLELLKQSLAESSLTTDQKDYYLSVAQGDTRSFPQWQLDMKKAGAQSTVFGQESAAAKGAGEAESKAAAELQAAGRAAPGKIASLGLLGSLLDQAKTGALGPLHATLVGGLQAAGIKPETIASLGLNPNQAISAEASQKIINELTVGQIGPGGFPANNFSDADRAFLTKIFPSVANRPESNLIAREVMTRIQEQIVKKNDAWADYRETAKAAGKTPSFDTFENMWRKQVAGEKIFDDLNAQVRAGFGNAPPPPPPAAAAPPPAAQPAPPTDGLQLGNGKPPPGIPPALIVDQAKKALARGQDPTAVRQILQSHGLDPKVLD